METKASSACLRPATGSMETGSVMPRKRYVRLIRGISLSWGSSFFDVCGFPRGS